MESESEIIQDTDSMSPLEDEIAVSTVYRRSKFFSPIGFNSLFETVSKWHW